MIKINCSWLK